MNKQSEKRSRIPFAEFTPELFSDLDALVLEQRAAAGVQPRFRGGRRRGRTVWHFSPLGLLVVWPLWRSAHLVWRSARHRGLLGVVSALVVGMRRGELPLRAIYRGALHGLAGCIVVKAGGHSLGIVYDIYARRVVKVPRPRRATAGAAAAPGSAKREIEALSELGGVTAVVPRLYYSGLLRRTGRLVLVSEYVPSGYAGGGAGRRRAKRVFQELAAPIARGMGEVYAAGAGSRSGEDGGFTAPAAGYCERFARRLQAGSVGFSSAARAVLTAAERLDAALGSPAVPLVTAHGDLLPHNVCARDRYTLKIIDWGKSKRRSVLFDLYKAELAFRAEFVPRGAPQVLLPLLRRAVEGGSKQDGFSPDEVAHPREELLCPLASAFMHELEQRFAELQDARSAVLFMLVAQLEWWPKQTKATDAIGMQLERLQHALEFSGDRQSGPGTKR